MSITLNRDSSGLTAPNSQSDLEDRLFVLHERIEQANLSPRLTATLKAFLKYLDTEGIRNMVDDIEHFTPQEFSDHAQHLTDALLVPMMARGGRTPSTRPSPRIGAIEDINSVGASSSASSATRTKQHNLKEACLLRDGYRCIATGFVDEAAIMLKKLPSHILENLGPEDLSDILIGARILPFSLGKIKPSYDSSNIWSTLYRCFPALRTIVRFSAENINDHGNMIILTESAHRQFGRFNFSFDETSVPNTYKIVVYRNCATAVKRDLLVEKPIEIKDHCSESRFPTELPHPVLLKVHHVVAQILNADRTAELIEKLLRDLEEIDQLQSNGSTNVEQVLSLALLRNAIQC